MEDNAKDDNNNMGKNNDKGISALGLDIDMGFSGGNQGHPGHQPHDDDDDEEDDDEVEDNDKDDNNNKGNNNDKGISALKTPCHYLVAELRYLYHCRCPCH